MKATGSTQLKRTFARSQDVRLPCCVSAKGGKAPTFPRKLVSRTEADGGDLWEAESGELATARFPRTPQLPLSFNETFQAAKTFFFLATSQLKAKKLKPFQKDAPFLKYCSVVT